MSDVRQAWEGEVLTHELFALASPRTAILMFPTVMGVTDLERGFARELNAKGHSVMIADLYGRRFTPEQRGEAMAAMQALRADRAAVRERLVAVFERFREKQGAAPLVAIGFCFGGQNVLDLARSGVELAGAASFHGLFDPPGLPPQPIAAKVIAFHGWDDPLTPPETVVALGKELTAAGCDWQLHGFGGVGHAFTNPGATGAMPGLKYDEQAARRSWAMLDLWLAELAA